MPMRPALLIMTGIERPDIGCRNEGRIVWRQLCPVRVRCRGRYLAEDDDHARFVATGDAVRTSRATASTPPSETDFKVAS